jgi:hypothetical protein
MPTTEKAGAANIPERLLQLVQSKGLIVVALFALIWQVFWLTSQSEEQDKLWRAELGEYRLQIRDMELDLSKQRADYAQLAEKVLVEVDNMSRIVASVAEECKVLETIERLQEKVITDRNRRN